MEKAKKSIEGLRLDLNIENEEMAKEAYKIVRVLPMYDIYFRGDKVIAKENYGFMGGKDDYDEDHFIVYDVASLDEERKNILKQALGSNYKTTEILVDKKKDIKSFFKRPKEEPTPGHTIEYYLPYLYVQEAGLDREFLLNYSYSIKPSILKRNGDYIRKMTDNVKDIILVTEKDNAFYRIYGDKISEVEELVDPNEILELVKVDEKTYVEPANIKRQSK